jgi:hypothetical protein
VVKPLFSPTTAATLKVIRHRGDATSRMFWEDAFVVWHLTRPGGWSDGTTAEGWHPMTLPAGVPSVGRLLESGYAGLGDQVSGGVIVNQAPYKFRCDKRVPVTERDKLVIGTRVFEVTAPVEIDTESDSMWVYLTERAGEPLPVEPLVTP